MKEAARTVDYRQLMKEVERVVGSLDVAGGGVAMEDLADEVIRRFRGQLGIFGGRLYHRDDEAYVLTKTFPGRLPPAAPVRVPRSYPPIERCLAAGTVYMAAGDPGTDPELEAAIGARTFAALEAADEEYILAFDVPPDRHREDVLVALGVVRHAVNQRLRQDRMADILRQAEEIHSSILPRRTPPFGVCEVAGRSEPMAGVGGDYWDYIPISERILGLAIADVTGHGLPAALQVRDIYTGLRMGLSRDFKIVRTVERLNDIVHVSTLTSRFVSMAYGELELDGHFIYVNAGHPPPFHLRRDGGVDWLDRGGPVLGPLPGTAYERGFLKIAPGELLVLYTDGMTEVPRGGVVGAEDFGEARLVDVARRHLEAPAKAIAAALFAAVEEWSAGSPPSDDRTVLVVAHRGG